MILEIAQTFRHSLPQENLFSVFLLHNRNQIQNKQIINLNVIRFGFLKPFSCWKTSDLITFQFLREFLLLKFLNDY